MAAHSVSQMDGTLASPELLMGGELGWAVGNFVIEALTRQCLNSVLVQIKG